MENPKISVIVPIYKVEEYLDTCVKSILEQTYKNIEIILVDDGSPDKCPQMCDEYARQDSRIKVVHKQNGGLSDARNAGIDVATGEYITLLDSDDWITPNFVEVLIRTAQKYNTPISIVDTVETDGTKKSEMRYSTGWEYKNVYTAEEALKVIFLQHEFNTGAGAKLYHKSIFDDMRFTKGILYEDMDIVYKLIEKAQKVSFSPDAQYYYLQRTGSIVHAEFDARHFKLIEISETILKHIDEKYPNLHDAVLCRYLFSNMLILSRVYKEKGFKAEKKQLCDNILTIKKEIYRNKDINTKQKIKVLIISTLRKLGRA